MKILLINAFLILFTGFAFGQKQLVKYKGKIDGVNCTMQYTQTTKKGDPGMEESITYKGYLVIGSTKNAKRINFTGYFEGNVIKLQEVVKGKSIESMIFDLSDVEDGYTFVGKRKVNNKTQIILLNEIKK